MASSTPRTLVDLPTGLRLAIGRHLGLDDSMMLRATARFLWNTVPGPTHDELMLAELEEWAIAKKLFPCFDCMRMRRHTKFGSLMHHEEGSDGGPGKHWFLPEISRGSERR